MPKYKFEIYTSLITPGHIYVKGRLLRDNGIKSDPKHGMLTSLFVSLMRALTRECKFVPMKIMIGHEEYNLNTDKEGYFELFENSLKIDKEIEKINLWAEVNGHEVVQQKPLRKYLHNIPYGIISDIDDTILVTRVKSFFKLKMLFNTVFLNPFRRKPIENAAKFYKQMLEHEDGHGPIIYISNSPWNLFDYLTSFLNHNDFPKGEIQLRDFGFHTLKKKKDPEAYNKYLEAEKMIQVFSNTRFTLVGDCAEKDFLIYSRLQKKFPDRIKRIILIKAGHTSNERFIRNFIDENSIPNMIIANEYNELL